MQAACRPCRDDAPRLNPPDLGASQHDATLGAEVLPPPGQGLTPTRRGPARGPRRPLLCARRPLHGARRVAVLSQMRKYRGEHEFLDPMHNLAIPRGERAEDWSAGWVMSGALIV